MAEKAPDEATDEWLDDIARELFADLCEGNGEHSEALDRALILKHLKRVNAGNEVIHALMQTSALGHAAVAWDQARRASVRLRAERGSIKCEVEEHSETDDMGRVTYDGTPACFNRRLNDEHRYGQPAPIEDWCDACKRRQAVHEEYRKVVARRQALLRGLQRRALAAREATAAGHCKS